MSEDARVGRRYCMDPDRKRTDTILEAVGAANQRVEALLGAKPSVCITYGGPKGEAMVLNRHGRGLFAFEDWDDSRFACEQAYVWLETTLWLFLR